MKKDKCYRCGAETQPLIRVSDGRRVCASCLSKYYEKCYICGDYADKREIQYNGGLCEACYDDEDD